jgi:hypothetical protein
MQHQCQFEGKLASFYVIIPKLEKHSCQDSCKNEERIDSLALFEFTCRLTAWAH